MLRFLLLGLFLINASETIYAQFTSESRPYVLLISFDGFRYDYVRRFQPPNFQKFIQNGTQAEALLPCFPSVTFPNHYSIVTGMYPATHGLVDNSFYDTRRGLLYRISDRTKVQDAQFYDGVPLWQLAQQNGLKSASFFWVGSEAPIKGEFPTYYYNYDGQIPNSQRIKQTLDWLRLPESQRPHFISLYFSLTDDVGHNAGPESAEIGQAVAELDSLLGDLMRGLAELKLPVNVILVSDHGMIEAEMNEANSIYFMEKANLRTSGLQVAYSGEVVHIYSQSPRKLQQAYTLLQQDSAYFSTYWRKDIPAHLHYRDNEKIGDLVLLSKHPYLFRKSRQYKYKLGLGGYHGLDPDTHPEMRGIFYAQGPQIQAGKVIPPFRNIHIYPLIAHILQLQNLPKIDGKLEVLQGILR
ncbi:MAG: ectonucleotide pyrophosphatase/phosphodiesterase [Microscillaceae bacterium]|jgi:predicted AlkP superfamily pyrophosphatase or phosphodiesterase|nr:ectonucleotide pyrophosphatase/phosphodiesterase [Microscillaceae bacterium]